jgi:formylglycine-generating enzyme required for sulfatase activity
MTIAQNVLSNPANWSGGSVGSGYIYSGHNDNAPASALIASTSDNSGYFGETNTGGNQRRTLTLTNGQVIWDFAGNVWEWTSGTSTTNQPGISGGGYAYREWTAITANGSLAINPFPSNTGLSGASSWNSSKGIGQIYSNSNETVTRAFLRGGGWSDSSNAGILCMNLGNTPGALSGSLGFRVSR